MERTTQFARPFSARCAELQAAPRSADRRGTPEPFERELVSARPSERPRVEQRYLQPGSGTLPCTRVPRPDAESTATVPPTAAMRSRMFAIPTPTDVSAGSNPAPESQTVKSSAPPVRETQPRSAPGPRAWPRCQARQGTRSTRRSPPRGCNAAHHAPARSPPDLIAHRPTSAPRPTRRRSAAPGRCPARGHAARRSGGRGRHRSPAVAIRRLIRVGDAG
jgi:hypothetical protein